MFVAWLALILLGGSLILYIRIQKIKFRFQHIPQEKGLPLLGDSLHFVSNPFNKQEALQTVKAGLIRFADKFKNSKLVVIWLGISAKVMLLDGVYVAQALKNNRLLDKPWQYRFLRPWLGDGLLIASGNDWKESRRLLNHVFHSQLLNGFTTIFNREGRDLGRQLIKNSSSNGRVEDIYPLIERVTLSVICETSMGVRLLDRKKLIERYLRAVKLVTSCAMLRSNSFFFRWDFIFKFSSIGRRYAQAVKTLHEFSWEVIENRLKKLIAERERMDSESASRSNRSYRQPLLGTLLNAYLDQCLSAGIEPQTDVNPSNCTLVNSSIHNYLNLSRIREEVDTFIFAGFDTTACALSWCIYLLAAHPHQQAAVRRELQTVLIKNSESEKEDMEFDELVVPHDLEINEKMLGGLGLLEACVKECLRLFSPVPIVLRQVSSPLKLEDQEGDNSNPMVIPEGCSCSIFLQHHHLNEKMFKNAKNFEPGRFLSTKNKFNEDHTVLLTESVSCNDITHQEYDKESIKSLVDAYKFIPFSAGPRRCIGQRFAMFELKIILAQLLLRYELSTDLPLDEVKSSYELVQKPAHRLPVRITPLLNGANNTFS